MKTKMIPGFLITLSLLVGCASKFSGYSGVNDPVPSDTETPSAGGTSSSGGTGGQAPTEPECTKDIDCNGDLVCNGTTLRCEESLRPPKGTGGTSSSGTGGSGGTGTGGTSSGTGGGNAIVGCTKDTECREPRICSNVTHLCEDPAPSNGTGGTSSSGGASGSGTGGSGGTGTGGTSSGTGGSSGSGGSGGSVSSGKKVTISVSVIMERSATDFSFAYLSTDSRMADVFDLDMPCTGNADTRECEFTVDLAFPWEFYMSTGLTGAGSWLPGMDGETDRCTAYSDIEVWYVNDEDEVVPVPFSMVEVDDGCHFRIEPGALLTNAASDDKDGDGVKTVDDCNDTNPSVLTCGGTGGSSGSNIRTMRFVTWGGDMASNVFEMTIVPLIDTVVCRSESAYDPDSTSTFGPVAVCFAKVDRSKEATFVTRVGNQWPTGYPYSGATTCESKNQRVFVDEVGTDSGLRPYGRYPYGNVVTAYTRVLETRYISQSDGCHIVLPPQ